MKAKKVMRDEHGPRHVTPAGRSVFYDMFPKAEADELVMRSTLLRGLEQWLKESGLTQTQAAKALGITQARVSDIRRGKFRSVQSRHAGSTSIEGRTQANAEFGGVKKSVMCSCSHFCTAASR